MDATTSRRVSVVCVELLVSVPLLLPMLFIFGNLTRNRTSLSAGV